MMEGGTVMSDIATIVAKYGDPKDPFQDGTDPFQSGDGGGLSTQAECSISNSAIGLANALVSGICNAAIAGSTRSIMNTEKKDATARFETDKACKTADAEMAKDTMNMKSESLDYARKAKEMEAAECKRGAGIDCQKKVEDAKARECAKNEKAAEGGDSKKARDGLRHFGATGYFYG